MKWLFKKRLEFIKKKNIRDKIKMDTPDNIKVMYGKFMVFSLVYLIFFFGVYPFVLVNILTKLSSIIIFSFSLIFYGYMVIDVWKKKGNYISEGFVLIIPLVLIAISFSFIKFLI